MKKFALLLAAMLLCTAFVGCAEETATEKETLVFGTSADYPPYEFHSFIDGKDTIVGYDVSLAHFIAEETGKELVIKDIGFDYLIGELAAGKIDIVIAAMEATPERLKEADFSDPYYLDEPAIIILRKEDVGKYSSIDDFKGKTVGAQLGTTKADIVTNDMPGAELLSLTTVNELVSQLTTKKCDAVILDAAVARQYVESYPELAVSTVALGEALPYCVAVAKGDPKNLLPGINAAIAKAKTPPLTYWMDGANALADSAE